MDVKIEFPLPVAVVLTNVAAEPSVPAALFADLWLRAGPGLVSQVSVAAESALCICIPMASR